MKKKTISALLVLVLCFALAAPAMAASYSDLTNHWAKEYMEDLATRGFLSGYADGTMHPDDSITVVETLALLSRFYSPTEAELALIEDDYSPDVLAVIGTKQLWACDELEVCLAAGIITKDEIKTLDLTKSIQKQQLALFLVRAIQKQTEAGTLSLSDLSYTDASTISQSCIGSVAELSKLGIVKGSDENKFEPTASTSRAVTAAMVSRALDYLENNNTVLAIKEYSGLSRISGVITSASGSSIALRCEDGLVREYSFTAAAKVTVNGTEKTLSSTYAGSAASLSVKNGAVTSIAVTVSSAESYAQGVVYSVSSISGSYRLYITESGTQRSVQYTVPSTAKVTRDGKEINCASIWKNDFVTIKFSNSTVTQITATSADAELKGEITEIKFGATVSLKLMDTSGVTYVFSFDIAYPPKITRGTTEISVDRLSVGSKVVVDVTDFVIKSISTESSESSITGELTSITSTTTGTQWVVTADGKSTTLTLDSNAVIYSGKTSILSSEVHAGDTVTVLYYGNTITEVRLVHDTNSSSKLSGSVLSVNSSSKQITLLTATEKIVYINLSTVNSIVNSSTGGTVSLLSISEGSQLLVYGSYKDASTFNGKLIVVEV